MKWNGFMPWKRRTSVSFILINHPRIYIMVDMLFMRKGSSHRGIASDWLVLVPSIFFNSGKLTTTAYGKQPKGCYSDLRNKTIFSKRKERSDKGKNRRRWSTSSLLYPSSNPKRHLVQYLISRINMAFGLGWFWPTLASQYSMGHCLAYKVSAWSSLNSKQTRFYSLLWPGSIE